MQRVPLSRSGRSMRTLDDSTNTKKIWDTKVPSSQRSFSVLERQQILAEIAYVCQPLLHLSTMGMFGFKSWIPWMISLSCDVFRYVIRNSTLVNSINIQICCYIFSQALHWTHVMNLTPMEQKEMFRRRYDMLIYLLRSPLYDFHTKKLILTILLMAKPKVPFANVISEFLMAYLPHYRKIYAYLWSK